MNFIISREARSMTSSTLPFRRLGIIGSLVGLLALIAAVLPHWVLPALYPL